MKATFELLHILLLRGWTIAGRERKGDDGKYEQVLEYRRPDGMSGSEFQACSDDRGFVPLSEFPPAVEEWIWMNVPMHPSPDGTAVPLER